MELTAPPGRALDQARRWLAAMMMMQGDGGGQRPKRVSPGSELLSLAQVACAVLMLVGSLGWLLAARARRLERTRLQRAAARAQGARAGAATSGSAARRPRLPRDSEAAGAVPAAASVPVPPGAAVAEVTTPITSSALPSSSPPPPEGWFRSSAACEGRWPGVSVVLPVKGTRPHSLSNWRSQLASRYPGPLQFVFVVESEQDPACEALRGLLAERAREHEQRRRQAAASADPDADAALLPPLPPARVVVAGLSTGRSQKIHNLLAGVASATRAVAVATAGEVHTDEEEEEDWEEEQEQEGWSARAAAEQADGAAMAATAAAASYRRGAASAPAPAAPDQGAAATAGADSDLVADSDPSAPATAAADAAARTIAAALQDFPYVLCLDDDVALARDHVALMVDCLERDSGLFMATGYPLDLPVPLLPGAGGGGEAAASAALSWGQQQQQPKQHPHHHRRSVSRSLPLLPSLLALVGAGGAGLFDAGRADPPLGEEEEGGGKANAPLPPPLSRPRLASPSQLWGAVLAHAYLAFHMPLLVGFAFGETTPFVWGGCMLLRARELVGAPEAAAQAALRLEEEREEEGGSGCNGHRRRRPPPPPPIRTDPRAAARDADDRALFDPSGVLRAWRRGGYSDDLVVAARCAAARRRVGAPQSALLPQPLAPTYPLPAYWNYLRRQLFVLDCYTGLEDKVLGRVMLAAHSAICVVILLGGLATVGGASAAVGRAVATAASGGGVGGAVLAALAVLKAVPWQTALGVAGFAAAQGGMALLLREAQALMDVLWVPPSSGGGGEAGRSESEADTTAAAAADALPPLQTQPHQAVPPPLAPGSIGSSSFRTMIVHTGSGSGGGSSGPGSVASGSETPCSLVALPGAGGVGGGGASPRHPHAVAAANAAAVAAAAAAAAAPSRLGLWRRKRGARRQQQQQPQAKMPPLPPAAPPPPPPPSAAPAPLAPSPLSPSHPQNNPHHHRPTTAHVSFLLLWLGFAVECALLPCAALWTWLHPHVEWGGVVYHRAGGRVVRVERNEVAAGLVQEQEGLVAVA